MKRSIFVNTVLAATFILGSAAGASAGEPATMSASEARELLANAKTPADHQKLADYYSAQAVKSEKEAQEHDGLADTYRNHPAVLGSKPGVPLTANAGHCNGLARSLRDEAKKDRSLAAEHEAIARASQK